MSLAIAHPHLPATCTPPATSAAQRPVARDIDTQAEPPCKAFYIGTTLASLTLFLLMITAVSGMIYFFTNVITTW